MAGSADAQPAHGTLGAHLRAVREHRGVTARSLARALDVSPATISQIENGRTGLSAARLRHIADVLGVGVSEIIDGAVSGDSQPAADPVTSDPATGETSRPPDDRPSVGVRRIPDWRVYEPLRFDPVLRGALNEILEIGYHGATVRSIAARCGFSVSGIYHHYTSKQQMLVAILDRAMTELLDRARAARADGDDPVRRFSHLVEHLVLFHTHRRDLGFVGASEMRSLEQPDRRRIAGMRTTQQRMVDEEVHAAVRAGCFRDEHSREAARAVVTMCTALANWWRPDGPFSPEQTAEQYVEFALAMMRYEAE